jgi:hypothetical protein
MVTGVSTFGVGIGVREEVGVATGATLVGIGE